MKPIKTILLLSVVFTIAGCSMPQEPVQITLPPKYVATSQPASQASINARKFDRSIEDGPSAVESAVEMSKKYAELSENTAQLRQDKKNLTDENQKLSARVEQLQEKLNQSEKELAEANELLRQMLIELNTWKSNVLGFQKEMREADTAQLEALYRVLRILGGELEPEPTAQQPTETDSTNTAADNTAGTGNQIPAGQAENTAPTATQEKAI